MSNVPRTYKKPFPVSAAVIGAVLTLLVAIIARSVAAGPQTTATPEDARKADRVAVSKSGGPDERAVLPDGDFVTGNGIVEPADRETKVSAQVSGRIAVLHVKEGDHVEAGSPIAELDSTVEKAAFEAAEGDLTVARAELTRTLRGLRREDIDAIIGDTEAARARAELSAGTLKRTEILAKTGASTPDELDRAQRQADADARSLAAAEARRKAAVSGSRSEDIVVAQAKVTAAQARRDQAKAQLDRLVIRAPITGDILQVKFRAGEYVALGGAAGVDPVVIMGDTQKLRVRMDVDERDIAKVRLGAPAFATLIAFPGRKVPGHVVEVGKRMGRKNVRTDDPTERIDTKILEVVIELERPQGLVPGLRVVSYVTPAAT